MEGIPKADFEQLRLNLEAVRTRIRRAEEQSQRPTGSVRLVAVTKKVSPSTIRALMDLGVREFGENRPEEAVQKAKILSEDRASPGEFSWHMIGHYQRKKLRSTLPLFTWVHSVHDVNLLRTLEDRMAESGAPSPQKPLNILLQANISGESAKQGFEGDEIRMALNEAEAAPHLNVQGLMTMAPFDAPESELRSVFSQLREIRDTLGTSENPLPELSMGMSRDFEAAILEGATMVRVGTSLFRGLSRLE